MKLLKEKCRLSLTVERNLDWAFSRAGRTVICSFSSDMVSFLFISFRCATVSFVFIVTLSS